MNKRFIPSLLALLLFALVATRTASAQAQIGMPAGSIPPTLKSAAKSSSSSPAPPSAKPSRSSPASPSFPAAVWNCSTSPPTFPAKGKCRSSPRPTLPPQRKHSTRTAPPALRTSMGGAFLIPYPNRVRGQLAADGKSITVPWQGQTLNLPGGHGPAGSPSAEGRASHGLIFMSKAQDVLVSQIPGGQRVTGVIHAGDFGGHWLSNTDLNFTVTLVAEAIDVSVVAHNIGQQPEPIAIGMHPYFNLPSGERAQARVRLPADTYSELDNYQSVIPTGKLLPSRRHQIRPACSRRHAHRRQPLRRQLDPLAVEVRRSDRRDHRSRRALWRRPRGPLAGHQGHPALRPAREKLRGR